MILVTVLILLLIFIVVLTLVVRDTREKVAELHPRVVQLKRLVARYFPAEMNKVRLFENSATYTLNKSKIYICVENADKVPYDDNTMIYVILHELAHALNDKDIGHSEAYRKIFTSLLSRAEKYGIYDPRKKKNTENFCVT